MRRHYLNAFNICFFISIVGHAYILFSYGRAIAQQQSQYAHFSSNKSMVVLVKKSVEKKKIEKKNKNKGKKKAEFEQLKNQEQQSVANNQESEKSAGEASELNHYLSQVRNLIEKNKYYPYLAKRLGHKGVVHVRFSLTPSGKVVEFVVENSSFDTLEKAVKKIITEKITFPSFSPQIAKKNLVIRVPVHFSQI